MKLKLQRASRLPNWPRWAVAVVTVWLASGAAAVLMGRYIGPVPRLCLFKRLTSYPCPTCGSTRGVVRLLGGQIASAVACNPLLFTAALIFAALILFRFTFARSVRLELTRLQRRAAWPLAAALLLANWVYVIIYVG